MFNENFDQEQTRAALPYAELIDALDQDFAAREAPLRHHHYLENVNEEDDKALLMPAWRAEGFGGIKLVNVVPGNSKRPRGAVVELCVV